MEVAPTYDAFDEARSRAENQISDLQSRIDQHRSSIRDMEKEIKTLLQITKLIASLRS